MTLHSSARIRASHAIRPPAAAGRCARMHVDSPVSLWSATGRDSPARAPRCSTPRARRSETEVVARGGLSPMSRPRRAALSPPSAASAISRGPRGSESSQRARARLGARLQPSPASATPAAWRSEGRSHRKPSGAQSAAADARADARLARDRSESARARVARTGRARAESGVRGAALDRAITSPSAVALHAPRFALAAHAAFAHPAAYATAPP